MTRQIRLGLYVEGPTDERFLPGLVRRLVSEKLANQNVDVLDPEIIILEESKKTSNRANNIKEAAIQAVGFDILIVHSDVDKRSLEDTYKQLIKPGLEEIKLHKLTKPNIEICDTLVPLLPQHTIEAWIIADQKNLRKLLNTNKSAQELGLPILPQIEKVADPKTILMKAIESAMENRPTRGRSKDLLGQQRTLVYKEMGEIADFEILRKLDSFQEFERNLEQTLVDLGFLH